VLVASPERYQWSDGLRSTWVLATSTWLLALTVGCQDGGNAEIEPAFERTEEREPCDDYSPLKRPFFGELHIHTSFSADAIVAGTTAGPREAYEFAKGAPIGIAPFDFDGNPNRVAQLGRPLDFAAVTDHSESFGDFPEEGPRNLAQRCASGGQILPDSECDASVIWMEMQDAAEEHYDRSAACGFTTFPAYEYTARRARGSNGALHRNVIFRNAEVPPGVSSWNTIPTAQGLWAALTADCLEPEGACDVLTIPHNSNYSLGLMFSPLDLEGEPFTAETARTRAAFEPLVEIMQSKGESECRPGVDTADELCGFEKINRTGGTFSPTDPDQEFQPLSFVRNGLKEGLLIEEEIGVNPFEFGVIAATDAHNAAPGAVRERDYPVAGNFGALDATPEQLLSINPPGGIEVSGGGLAVLWAEENSRDALFSAMRRREAYATSGPRMVVRFFGGDYPEGLCDRNDFVEQGYQAGVPMGGVLGPDQLDGSPRFAVQALRDPGTSDFPGALLQRAQIVKGWVDADGQAREMVYDVAGDPDNGATVDPEVCVPEGPGFDSLCAVWADPDFDPSERAFYYVRVLENPTCRWHSFVCNDLGVDCDQPGSVPEDYVNCCDPNFPRVIQERAWTSPIFYSPEKAAPSE